MKLITTLSARAETIGPFKIASRPEALQYRKAHFLQLFVQNLEKKNQARIATDASENDAFIFVFLRYGACF